MDVFCCIDFKILHLFSVIMTNNIESKIILPNYSSTDEFVFTFSQIMKSLRWCGIPWGGSKIQRVLSQAMMVSIFIGILSSINRLFIDMIIGKIFLRVAGTTKYASAFVGLLIISRLYRMWPTLSSYWTTSNYILKSVISSDVLLRRRILRVAMVYMIFFPMERLILLLTSESMRTSSSVLEFLRSYITKTQSYLISRDQYTHLFGVIIFFQILFTTLVSNLQDFIVIAFSLGLSSRQKLMNNALKYLCKKNSYRNSIQNISPIKITAGKHLNWRKLREMFVRHTTLVEHVDSAIGPIILLSLFSNLLYILMIVFSLNYKTDSYVIIYNLYALVWLIIRSFTLLLTASDVHDLSIQGLDSITIVKTECYSVEVRRLQFQLSKNEITLSGMGFFKLKRSLILKVLSVIITYDLILLQYNGELS